MTYCVCGELYDQDFNLEDHEDCIVLEIAGNNVNLAEVMGGK